MAAAEKKRPKDEQPPYLARDHLQSKVSVGRAPPINDVWTEAYCKECKCRVTVSGEKEYGHARGVAESKDECSHHVHGGSISSDGGR